MNDQERILQYIDEHVEEMVADTMELCRINSEKGEAEEGMPYGKGPCEALHKAAEICGRYGFTVTNYDNHVITADLNDQERHLDILAHMDVVAAGEGWTVTKPYEPIVKDGKIFGRGSSDDKGPAMAALYAMRAVKELQIPLKKNCRLILGSDEECGSSDIAYYYQKEPEAAMTFSPDTCFLTSNRTQGNVYQFSTYTVGGTPRTKSMSTDYYVTGSSVRSPVYGEDGIWDSATDVTVGVTQYLYVYAEMTVSSGSTLTVENGGRLINSGNIYLVGTLQNDGEVVNHGIIEKREGGNISGNEPSGEGYVAYCINVSPTDGRIDVMASDDDTVVLRTDSTVYISRISVLLENGDREVTITVPETLYVGGDEFVISLRQVGGDDGIGTYDLNIIGIDPEVLGSLRVEVTVSCGLSTDTT